MNAIFFGPAKYQITVEGIIGNNLLGNLGDMSVAYSTSKDTKRSILTGEVIDQPALSGILNTLIDNRYTVISVMKIDQ